MSGVDRKKVCAGQEQKFTEEEKEEEKKLTMLVQKSFGISTGNGYRFPSHQFGYSLQSVDSFGLPEFTNVLRRYMCLEYYCNAVDDYTHRTPEVDYREVDLFQAVFFPRSICPRTPMNAEPITIMTENTVRIMWFRLAAHYFEWVTGVHELQLFEDSDKIKIIVSQICMIVCLNCAYSNHLFHCSDPTKSYFMFGSGFYYDPARCTDSYMSTFCHEMYNQMMLLLPKMKEMSITKEELVLVKLCYFFDCTNLHGLTTQGLEITRSICTKYKTILAEYVRHLINSNPENADMSEEERNIKAVRRVQDLLSFWMSVEKLVRVDDNRLSEMVQSNYGEMQGTLQKQIHTEYKKMHKME